MYMYVPVCPCMSFLLHTPDHVTFRYAFSTTQGCLFCIHLKVILWNSLELMNYLSPFCKNQFVKDASCHESSMLLVCLQAASVATKLQSKATNLQSTATKLQIKATKIQSKATKIQSEATKIQSEATKLQTIAMELQYKLWSYIVGQRSFGPTVESYFVGQISNECVCIPRHVELLLQYYTYTHAYPHLNMRTCIRYHASRCIHYLKCNILPLITGP